MGFDARKIEVILSHHNVGAFSTTPRYLNNALNHDNSAAVYANCRYSASMLERDTVFCFFELHEIGLKPK